MTSGTHQPPDWADARATRIVALLTQLHECNDHVLAIVTGAFVDEQIEDLLRHAMRSGKQTDELLEDSRALGSMSVRITLSYSLKLISDDIFRMLNRIRKIRNAAAHTSLEFRFSDPPASHQIASSGIGLGADPRKVYCSMVLVVVCYLEICISQAAAIATAQIVVDQDEVKRRASNLIDMVRGKGDRNG
ncbi:MAG: hypothetical protein KF838_09370 [Phycisphaeraceae bacterium]|nr:MAG: hypothetical protein KF838_09370 [Phycisphaeraceae bacterium]